MNGYFQPVEMVSSRQPAEINVTLGKRNISSPKNIVHISGQQDLTEGDWIFLDSADQDLHRMDLRDKMVLYIVDRNDDQNPRQIIMASRQIKSRVVEQGAKGFIEIFKQSNRFWNRIYNYYGSQRIRLGQSGKGKTDVTHIIIRDIDDFFSADIEAYSEMKFRIEISGWNNEKFVTNNVVGVVKGKDPDLKDEYIICTAHYDHVGIGRPDHTGDSIYNGARDNAIGVMSAMMAAENISEFPVDRSVIFILFTGEEKGLLGSRWFVENAPVPLRDIVFCLNIDGGGYNDTTIATIMGKKRIKSHGIFEQACDEYGIEAFEGSDDLQFLFKNSDNIRFSQKGIPSVTFSPGFRNMDAEILKYYHQPSDEVESMDFDYVYKYCSAIGLSLRMIANSEEKLFWKEGDEFFSTGQELYR
jgi:hypothetical protein